MIVIIEGPDLAGKTTYAETWFPGYQYHHSTAETEDYHMPDLEGDHIFDRFHLSEFIYGQVLRGFSRLSFDQMIEIECNLTQREIKRILLLPDWKVLKKRYEKRGDDLVDLGQLWRIYRRYEVAQFHFPGWEVHT